MLELYCKICAPHLTGNGYCAEHSSTGKAYFDDEIKQFVYKMIPAFNQGYKQWHEKEWKEFISQIRDQFKQEVIRDIQLEKTSRKYTGHDRELYCSGLNKAIEIIKSK